jgi:sodium-dependent dicarboxylate transporter 2/3/5
MSLLQNVIILTTGFLLSQVLIARNTHFRLIAFLLRHGGTGLRSLLTSVLLISYSLSIFLSNTVVVLALLPVIHRLMEFVTDRVSKKEIATLFYLSLTFGATTGGLASLIGNPLNAFAVGLLEFYRIENREEVNFFSWLMVGLPASLAIIAAGRRIILHTARNCSETALLYPESPEPVRLPHRALLFFALNMAFITILSGVQFFVKPGPLLSGMSWIDLSFLCYGTLFVLFSFLYPVKKGAPENILKNAVFLFFFIAAFPLLLLSRVSMEIERHMRIPLMPFYHFVEKTVQILFNKVWLRLFHEPADSIESANNNAVLSVNTIILDIPYFGLLLVSIFGSLLYFGLNIGNNPATPQSDGYLITGVTALILGMLEPLQTPLLFIPALNVSVAFSSELLSNTAIVVILSPLMIATAPHTGLTPLLLLLSLATAASAAFMTPLASPANTLAFGGFERLSLKTILAAGMLMNIIATGMISIVFLVLSFLL